MCSAGVEGSEAASGGVQAVLAAIGRLSLYPGACTPDALAEDLLALRRGIDLLELRFATRAAALDIVEWPNDVNPHGSVGELLSAEGHMTGSAAGAAVCVGEQLPRLGHTVAAVEAGRIGTEHVALLARTSAALEELGVAFHEEELVARAAVRTPLQFAFECRQVRHQASAARFLEEHCDQVAQRWLQIRSNSEGMVCLSAQLDPVAGATVRAALEPLARRIAADDERLRGQRLADALLELAGHGLDSGAVPPVAGQRPHLQVTASVETLLGIPGARGGEMEFAPPIPGATVQRFGCDAMLTRVLFGAPSKVVDVGETQRLARGATRTALVARDRGCSWPSCERPPSWTEAHHLVHWAHGGGTDLDNLVLLCALHHRRVHEGGWTLVRSEEGLTAVQPPPRRPVIKGPLFPEGTSTVPHESVSSRRAPTPTQAQSTPPPADVATADERSPNGATRPLPP